MPHVKQPIFRLKRADVFRTKRLLKYIQTWAKRDTDACYMLPPLKPFNSLSHEEKIEVLQEQYLRRIEERNFRIYLQSWSRETIRPKPEPLWGLNTSDTDVLLRNMIETSNVCKQVREESWETFACYVS